MLRVMLELINIRFFPSSLIKNIIYWPRYFPGKMVYDHMSPKDVGGVDTVQ